MSRHGRRAKSRKTPLTRPLSSLLALLDRLPIPRLGPAGQVAGVAGLAAGTLGLSLVFGIVLRAMVARDVLNPFRASGGPPTATPNATPNPTFLAPTLDLGNAVVWQGNERVTVLLMGADSRPSERGRARPRTDSMMLLMIDPQTKVASVLSIPRDLYVDIPGYGLNRINTAYVLGGGDLAMETMQYNLGLRVNYYVLVEFDAFVALVDEIGGIDIYVPQTIYDPEYPDMNYGYDPFYITAGQHHMDGATALKYARTRHSDSDFNRARRQQDVLFAIRDHVLSLDMLPMLVQKSPVLYDTLSDSIETNLTLEQIVSLALLAQDVPRENIRTGVIDGNYVTGYVTSSGAQVLIPNRGEIGGLLTEVFWLN